LESAPFLDRKGKDMADYLNRNMSLLIKHNPVCTYNDQYFKRLVSAVPLDQDVYFQKQLYFKYEGKDYCLTGKKPEEEAVYMMKQVEPRKDHLIILIGMANIELLKHLELDTSEGTKIAVFEPNLKVMKYCLKNYNLQAFISSSKFGFMLGDKRLYERHIITYFSGSWENLVQNLIVISNPNYYMYQDFKMDVMKLVNQKIDHVLKSLGNSLPDMLFGLNNHYLDIDACVRANDSHDIKDRYKGCPAIIVASGPSLDKNIDDLRQAQGKALILACDASYQSCIRHGITPDAIISMERVVETYDAFYKGRTFNKGLVLMGPSLLWPNIHEEFPGKQLYFTKNKFGTEGMWRKLFPKHVFVDMGHSCATAACGIAKYAGCDPVILVGQDLAYTDEKRHSEEIQDEHFQASNDLTKKDKEKQDLWVEDIYGNMVRTNDVFNLFRTYFENTTLKEGTLIDATEGGALIRGTKIMKLSEAIQQYCTREIPSLDEILPDLEVTDQMYQEAYSHVLEHMETLFASIKRYQERTVEYYHKLEKYIGNDFKGYSEKQLRDVVLDLQEGNSILEMLRTENDDLVTYFQHILKYTIIYVKKIGNELTPENVKRNVDLQANLMRMIDVTAVAVDQKLREMKKVIEEKQAKLGAEQEV